jgi:subtilisin family serine protease
MPPASNIRRLLTSSVVLALGLSLAPAGVQAAPPGAPLPWNASPPRTVPGEVVVTFEPGTSRAQANAIHARVGAASVDRAGRRTTSPYVVRVGAGNVASAIRAYQGFARVRTVEANRIAVPALIPADPRFGQQWALDNTGQVHRISDHGLRGTKQAGKPGADVNAPEAWDIETGDPGVVIAVIDSGVDIDHQDLASSMWVNTLEDAGTHGVDDDGNGYVDDVHGYDLQHDDPNPSPSAKDPHGTHVAGIIAAEQDADGISGICPGCRIMGLRFDFSVGQEIEAIEYAVANGADIINMSFGGSAWSPAERNAIEAAGEAGVLTVVSAGNSSLDNDISLHPLDSPDFAPSFPASYALPSILTVAASDDRDRYAAFSQCRFSNIPRWACAFTSWGHDSVDIAAPGADIVSTVVNGGSFGNLDVWDGTSMAAPLVAGIAGLVKSHNPAYDDQDLKNAIMNSVANPSPLNEMETAWAPLVGVTRNGVNGRFTRTSGRVDALAALTGPITEATPLTDGNIDGATAMGHNASGRVEWPEDTNDVWAVELQKGKRYTITLDGPRTHDLDLWIWSSTAVEIHQFTSGCFRRRGSCPALTAISATPSGEEQVRFRARKTGTHYLHVNAWYDEGRYDLKVRT